MREFAQLVSWKYSSGANYLVLTLVCMFDLAFAMLKIDDKIF